MSTDNLTPAEYRRAIEGEEFRRLLAEIEAATRASETDITPGIFGFCWVASIAIGVLYAVTGDEPALISCLFLFAFPFGFALMNRWRG